MSMRSSQVRALIAKDLRLHGHAVALATAGCLLLLALATRVMPQGIGPRVSFVFNVNLLFTLLWSDWLITRERSKRTFAWLRGLPVDDRVLGSAKFIAAAGCSVALWLVSSVLFARELWRPPGTALVLQCAIVAFGGLSVAAKWRFSWRLGQVLPPVVGLMPVLLFMALAGDGTDRHASLLALWDAPYGRPLAAASLLAVYAAIVTLTLHWITHADTFQLVD